MSLELIHITTLACKLSILPFKMN